MKYKKYLLNFFAGGACLLLFVGFLNYAVDPYMIYGHGIRMGKVLGDFDERQFKTNYLTINGGGVEYDTLIMGSSRMAYVNPKDVPGKAFNYSANSCVPWEFPGYGRHFYNVNGPLDHVVLGVLFFETMKNVKTRVKSPDYFISRSKSLGLGPRFLFSMTLFKQSLLSFYYTAFGKYNGHYVRTQEGLMGKSMVLPKYDLEYENNLKKGLAYSKKQYDEYVYKDNRPHYRAVKEIFKEADFHVFITPEPSPALDLLVKEGLYPYYERWIRDLVEVFGSVWTFAFRNSVTENPREFFVDSSHCTPYLNGIMIKKVYGIPVSERFSDFGFKITQGTLEEDLQFLRDNILNTRPFPGSNGQAHGPGSLSKDSR